MGASNIFAELPGDRTEDQVRESFAAWQESDRIGCWAGTAYSGSWATIPHLVVKDSIFDDFQAAEDYCLDNSEKWENAVAVRFNRDGETFWLVEGWAAT